MWLPVMLLAFMASGSACPELCQCHQTSAVGYFPGSSPPILTNVTCRGRAPTLSELPGQTQMLIIAETDEQEVIDMLDQLDANDTIDMIDNNTSRLPYMNVLTINNCSLVTLNVSWSGLQRLRLLNLSFNELANVDDLQVAHTMNLTQLKSLDLSSNSLENVSADSFRTLAGLVWLSLRGNKIATVHEEAFRGLDLLEGLDFSDNRLSDLPDSALTPLYSLQKLDLSGNQLQVLGARWFESLDRLRELDVSRNGLARAASGTLQPLPGLSVLRLAENPLKERDVSLLLGTGRRLETVDASRTGLARVPAALTRSVRTLRLAGNKLTTIRSGDLDSYPLLRMLDISDNRLIDIEEDALGRLEVLEELDISGNLLPQIPGSLPNSLTHLDLQYNAITSLRASDLQGLCNLRCLMLNNNDITKIEEGSLGQLPALVELDLSNNPIKALPANTLSGPSNLATLRMSGLTYLQSEQQKQSDMSFPVPTPERLVLLDISLSPALAAQLLADDAALSACKSLVDLNLSNTNITTLRSDLVYLLPQLRTLGLAENEWNCTEDLYWLGDWIRQHKEHKLAQCSAPEELYGLFLSELPTPPSPLPTSTSTTTTTTSFPTSIIYLFEQTIPFIEDNVTESSYTNNINASEIAQVSSVIELSMEAKLRDEKTVSPKILTSAEFSSTIVATTKSPTTHSNNKQNNPVIFEAPTSFRNITAPQGTQKVKKVKSESSRKKNDIANRSVSIGNLTKETTSSRNKSIKAFTVRKVDYSKDQIVNNRMDGKRQTNGKTKKLDSSRPGKFSSGSTKSVTAEEDQAKKTTKNDERKNLTEAMITNTIAEELSGQATDSGARVSESPSTGAHPGMLVLAGAALSAAAALTVVLSRRATTRRRERYQRQENIEVHTLTPTTELW